MADRPIAATLGDPAGIGPELIGLAWLQRKRHDLPVFYCLADGRFLRTRLDAAGLDVPLASIGEPQEALSHFGSSLPVVELKNSVQVGQVGSPSPRDALAVLESIERGVADIRRGQARALVTAPIQKETLYASGFDFPGHTEYLGALTRDWQSGDHQPVMMLVSETLRIVPVTVHVPLADVAALLTEDLLVATARIVASEMTKRFRIEQPRLAVAGLNPHAGEGGRLGLEEQTIIAPAIHRLRAEGIDIEGPLSADTMFHPQARAAYDVALAMYHDQALIPIKTIAFDSAVNLTLGLPLVRTSPDHGTALALAGTGRANPSSYIEAMRLADRLSRS